MVDWFTFVKTVLAMAACWRVLDRTGVVERVFIAIAGRRVIDRFGVVKTVLGARSFAG